MAENSNFWYFENVSMMKVLKPSELMELEKMTVMVELQKNQAIYFPQDEARTIYFLKKGKVKISMVSENGKEIIRRILGPGEIFGELVLAGERKREDLAMALEDVIICKVNQISFKHLMSKNPDLNFAITKFIGLRFKKVQTRLENLMFKTSEQRITWFIKDFAKDFGRQIIGFPGQWHVDMKLTHMEIGKLTATSRQMVTTVLRDLESKGIIKYDRKRIYILDINRII